MILCGIAIVFLALNTKKAYIRFGIILAASIILLMAFLTLLEYFFQLNLGISEFIVVDPINQLNMGKMSPTTAFCFLNIAISILLVTQSTFLSLKKIIIPALSTTVIIISCIIFFSYVPNLLFNVHILSSASMGIHTALAFVLLGSSLFILIYIEDNFSWAINPFATALCFIGLLFIVFISDIYQNYVNQTKVKDEIIIEIQQYQKEINSISINLSALQNSEYHFIEKEEKQFRNQIIQYLDNHCGG